ncbi:MAG: ABC transporter substrate-binding protein, partial [Myxococcota bacterium]
MNDSNDPLRIATVVALFVVALSLLFNTCAMDRLEKQVIRTREALEQGGGRRIAAPGPSSGKSASGEPGSGTGEYATGWLGATAEIQFVSGASPDGVLTIADKPKPQGDHYVSRMPGAPSSLNFYTTNEGRTSVITRYTLERMLNIEPKDPSKVRPELATSWEVSDDKLTYTYHLREGVLFADGRPFTSADVKFSWDVMRDPEVNAQHLRGVFESAESLEAPDPYTIVVKYREKDWTGLYAVGYQLRVLNKGWYEEQIPKYAERLDIEDFSVSPGTPGFGAVFNKIRVPCPGTGPYYYEAATYDGSTGVELIQNPFWWGMQVEPEWHNFAKQRWVTVTDDVAAFEEFRKGTFDVMVIDHAAWDDEYSKDPGLSGMANYYNYDHMGLGFSLIVWNAREAPLDDPRVRRAMTHLTDRQWILDEVERGRGAIAICYGKPIYPQYDTDLPALAYDLEEAKRLLAEAGWTDSDGDGVLDRDGKRFEIEVKVGSPRRFYSQVVGLFQDAAAKVGIRVTMRSLEWSTFIEDFYERRFDGAVLYNSFPDPWIDPYGSYHSSQDIPRGTNASGWRNDEADSLLE